MFLHNFANHKKAEIFWTSLKKGLSGAKVCKSCVKKKILNNNNFVMKIGVDTAENELPKVWS